MQKVPNKLFNLLARNRPDIFGVDGVVEGADHEFEFVGVNHNVREILQRPIKIDLLLLLIQHFPPIIAALVIIGFSIIFFFFFIWIVLHFFYSDYLIYI